MKKKLAVLTEWFRFGALALIYFCAYSFWDDPVARFHVLGPFAVMVMSGSVAFEGLFLGEVASEKIGYVPNRAYQVQSALANLAIAVGALIFYVLHWGLYADAAVVVVMLLFFIFSAINHAWTAIKNKNRKIVNLMRPVMTLLLVIMLLWPMVQALNG